jgi:hypothetical protein
MNPDREEEELRERFGALRRADAARAPAFAVRAGPPVRLEPAWGRIAAAAALLALCAGLAFHRPAPRPAAVDWASYGAVADWRAPTDFLLAAAEAAE